MSTVEPGSTVIIRTADGKTLDRRAITGVERGSTFDVVWVCKEEEWVAATREGRDPESVPWPAEDVTAVVAA